MKLQIIFILGLLIQAYAGTSHAQVTNLNLTFQDNSLKEVLLVLEENTGFSFVYQDELISSGSKISGSYNGKSVAQVLDDILPAQGLDYSIKGKAIVILPGEGGMAHATVQQQRTVKGTVTDPAGNPLPGVAVVIKGTTTGTTTDIPLFIG